jgi:hypothetical protein
MNLTEQRNDRLLLSAHRDGLEHGRAGGEYCHNPYCPINEGGLWEAWDDGWTAGTANDIELDREAA